jgi:hypothetical protein
MDERKRAKNAPPLTSGTGEWRLDPNEVRLQRRRLKESQEAGPLGKLLRYGMIALLLIGAVGVYLNWELLRGVTLNTAALNALLDRDAPNGEAAPGEIGAGAVEAPGVAGDALPSSLDELPPEEVAAAPPPAAVAPAPAPAPATEAPDAAPPVVAEARPAPEPPPPPPPPEPEPDTPEVFDFGLDTISVSESEASARLLILRNGGRRRVSTVTWWTEDGTAKAGTDYASLGRQVVRFAAGEQNRSIQIPIVGDRNAEGPETFTVHLALGEGAGQSVSQIEVIINDDD